MVPHDFQEQLATIAMENAALKERVAVLEQADRRKRWATIGALVAVGLVISIQYLPQILNRQVFSGRWWEIHDRQGRMSAWFDDTGLQFKDKQGRVRAKLGLFPEGTPFLQMFSESGAMKAQLFIYPADDAGYLMLWGKDGKGVRYPPSATPMP